MSIIQKLKTQKLPKFQLLDEVQDAREERLARAAFILFCVIAIGVLCIFGLIMWSIGCITINEIIK